MYFGKYKRKTNGTLRTQRSQILKIYRCDGSSYFFEVKVIMKIISFSLNLTPEHDSVKATNAKTIVKTRFFLLSCSSMQILHMV